MRARSVLMFLSVALHAGTVIVIHELLVRRLAMVRLLFNGEADIQQVRAAPGLLRSLPRAGR